MTVSSEAFDDLEADYHRLKRERNLLLNTLKGMLEHIIAPPGFDPEWLAAAKEAVRQAEETP